MTVSTVTSGQVHGWTPCSPSTAQRAAKIPHNPPLHKHDIWQLHKDKRTRLQHWLMLYGWLWLCCLVEKPFFSKVFEQMFHSLVDCLSVIWRSPFQYDWCQGWACWRKSDLHVWWNGFWKTPIAASVALSPNLFDVFLGMVLAVLVWPQWCPQWSEYSNWEGYISNLLPETQHPMFFLHQQ